MQTFQKASIMELNAYWREIRKKAINKELKADESLPILKSYVNGKPQWYNVATFTQTCTLDTLLRIHTPNTVLKAIYCYPFEDIKDNIAKIKQTIAGYAVNRLHQFDSRDLEILIDDLNNIEVSFEENLEK